MSAHPIVIIAEPDSMISSVLRVEFTHMDCTVLLAADAKEAEEYAWFAAARLIVLDAGRLGLGAFLACARIRRFPGYARRTIVLTAKDVSDRTRAASEKAGATMLLAKPYSVSDGRTSGMAGGTNPRPALRRPVGPDPQRPAAADRAGSGG